MNAGTFLENLRDCHELDADKGHWTRFGSTMFAYTTRRENNGEDSHHRFPAKVLEKGEVCKSSEAKKRRDERNNHSLHHLTSNFDPCHHGEVSKQHDHHLERIRQREAFRRKQRSAEAYRHTHTHVRKKKMKRTNEFVTTSRMPIWGEYTRGKAPVPFLRTRNKHIPGSKPLRPQSRVLRASDARPHPGIKRPEERITA